MKISCMAIFRTEVGTALQVIKSEDRSAAWLYVEQKLESALQVIKSEDRSAAWLCIKVEVHCRLLRVKISYMAILRTKGGSALQVIKSEDQLHGYTYNRSWNCIAGY